MRLAVIGGKLSAFDGNTFTGNEKALTLKAAGLGVLGANTYDKDTHIIIEDGKATDVDLKHCKGCGICAKECPESAIAMKSEEKE